MTRHNFPQSVRKAALARAAGRCEATGHRYGHQPGQRCDAVLAVTGVHLDHYPRGAHDPDPATVTLDNCVVTCPACNLYAARHFDIQSEAKIKRVRRRAGLIPDLRKHKPKPIRSRGFDKTHSKKFSGEVVRR